jgi:radical SAM superfamily enzyme YgiQ (UPF0313 family)
VEHGDREVPAPESLLSPPSDRAGPVRQRCRDRDPVCLGGPVAVTRAVEILLNGRFADWLVVG